jgi:hypothetical protein
MLATTSRKSNQILMQKNVDRNAASSRIFGVAAPDCVFGVVV